LESELKAGRTDAGRAVGEQKQQYPIENMKTAATNCASLAAGLVLTLLLGAASQVQGQAVPKPNAVTAYGDFSIVPPNLGPYLLVGADGDLYLQGLPLVGRFTLNGKGISLEAKMHVNLSGELDATGTGVTWFPVTITTTIDGVKAIVFEGQGSANEVNLVAVGKISLTGRGPYEGSRLELTFEEIGPGDSNTFNFRGDLMPAPQR
jgi:hypothetical protein